SACLFPALFFLRGRLGEPGFGTKCGGQGIRHRPGYRIERGQRLEHRAQHLDQVVKRQIDPPKIDRHRTGETALKRSSREKHDIPAYWEPAIEPRIGAKERPYTAFGTGDGVSPQVCRYAAVAIEPSDIGNDLVDLERDPTEE